MPRPTTFSHPDRAVVCALLGMIAALGASAADDAAPRPRTRDFGLVVGEMTPGPANDITDVPGRCR